LAKILGIKTTLDGNEPYPSLVGQMRRQPDPNELLRKMERLIALNELKRLYTEPNDGYAEEETW
jgi:hypothetical protein